MNKLRSAKSTQTQIDSESSTANAQIHKLSLQIDDLVKQRDDLKSVVNKCDVQKEKLMANALNGHNKVKSYFLIVLPWYFLRSVLFDNVVIEEVLHYLNKLLHIRRYESLMLIQSMKKRNQLQSGLVVRYKLVKV
jgi:hypothetical protein